MKILQSVMVYYVPQYSNGSSLWRLGYCTVVLIPLCRINLSVVPELDHRCWSTMLPSDAWMMTSTFLSAPDNTYNTLHLWYCSFSTTLAWWIARRNSTNASQIWFLDGFVTLFYFYFSSFC